MHSNFENTKTSSCLCLQIEFRTNRLNVSARFSSKILWLGFLLIFLFAWILDFRLWRRRRCYIDNIGHKHVVKDPSLAFKYDFNHWRRLIDEAKLIYLIFNIFINSMINCFKNQWETRFTYSGNYFYLSTSLYIKCHYYLEIRSRLQLTRMVRFELIRLIKLLSRSMMMMMNVLHVVWQTP